MWSSPAELPPEFVTLAAEADADHGQVADGRCHFVSRKGNVMKRFEDLCSALARELKVKNAVLDGEVVAIDESGMPAFYDLLRRKSQAAYFAFDILVAERRGPAGPAVARAEENLTLGHSEKIGMDWLRELCRSPRGETFRAGEGQRPRGLGGEAQGRKI